MYTSSVATPSDQPTKGRPKRFLVKQMDTHAFQNIHTHMYVTTCKSASNILSHVVSNKVIMLPAPTSGRQNCPVLYIGSFPKEPEIK